MSVLEKLAQQIGQIAREYPADISVVVRESEAMIDMKARTFRHDVQPEDLPFNKIEITIKIR